MKRNRKFVDGIRVKDAIESVEVELTEGDIRKGKKKNPLACGFSVAICRELGATQARVNPSRIYIAKKGVYYRYRTPKGMTDQINLFDKTGQMGAGVYTIPPPSPSERLGRHKPKSFEGPKRIWYTKRTPRKQRPVYKTK